MCDTVFVRAWAFVSVGRGIVLPDIEMMIIICSYATIDVIVVEGDIPFSHSNRQLCPSTVT